ncbi:MAG TPA: primosomal protein N' [Patescibacteria group bacterium]|nr:primosomal protein N' [Patescibacteria group bacterium]
MKTRSLIADIIPATRTNRGASTFSYRVPDSISSEINVGNVVEIPLKEKKILGVVQSLYQRESEQQLKDIYRVAVEHPAFNERSIRLFMSLSKRFAAPPGLFVKSALIKISPKARKIEELQKGIPKIFNLTEDQKNAIRAILGSLLQASAWLLHGVTGSGKTEVYLQVASEVVASGGQVLILVPEIALTPQTLARFAERFNPKILGVIHSKISYGQKNLLWHAIAEGSCQILIGPRSAIFAPFSNLKLLVMDEEHDSSYKQDEQNPRFHARAAVLELSRLWDCPVIFGDATPSVELYHAATCGEVKLLKLPTRPSQRLPQVSLVDMREEARAGNFTNFSSILLDRMSAALQKKRQIILFLNRRGTATGLQCRDCGEFVMCKYCSVTVVYHREARALVCHHCGRHYGIPATCGICKSVRLRFVGSGTEKIEKQVQELFPQAHVRRADRDSVNKRSDFATLYNDFSSEKFDILVGTQILARGWDLHRVELIGVINADTALAFPDFRSNERTFDLATQVSGRAGRGDFPGSVVLQTYSPDNPAIQAAISHDYLSFFNREIQDRQEYGYPPFVELIELSTRSSRQETALMRANLLATEFKELPIKDLQIIGPAPAFISRERGAYKMRVILKLPKSQLEENLNPLLWRRLIELPAWWDVNIDPNSLL